MNQRASYTTSSPPNSAPHRSPTFRRKSRWRFCWDRDKSTCCGRTFISWITILVYSILYLLLLIGFTALLVYISLLVIGRRGNQGDMKSELYANEDLKRP